jgi:hypothetical protein
MKQKKNGTLMIEHLDWVSYWSTRIPMSGYCSISDIYLSFPKILHLCSILYIDLEDS